MIVHLTGSARNIEEDLPSLRKIITVIHENGCNIARNWVEAAAHRVMNDGIKDEEVDWRHVIEANRQAVTSADVVIAEASTRSFLEGYLVNFALEQCKPVLIVGRTKISSHAFSGIVDKNLTIKEYKNDDELTETVTSFLQKNMIPSSEVEQEVVVSHRVRRYLEVVSEKTQKTESEILTHLLEDAIMKKQEARK